MLESDFFFSLQIDVSFNISSSIDIYIVIINVQIPYYVWFAEKWEIQSTNDMMNAKNLYYVQLMRTWCIEIEYFIKSTLIKRKQVKNSIIVSSISFFISFSRFFRFIRSHRFSIVSNAMMLTMSDLPIFSIWINGLRKVAYWNEKKQRKIVKEMNTQKIHAIFVVEESLKPS